MNNHRIPQSVRATLWSYDVDRMDVLRDKERIITNVLNYGTKDATDWLKEVYNDQDMIQVVKNPRPGEWNKKSLNFWATVFNIIPNLKRRF